ncbi:alpha-L-arabinofuranosidase [Acidobacteria bacterium AB60]|nr:alpha-L-arabinofuranosidase [Acidobacteria bacterium AB60]
MRHKSLLPLLALASLLPAQTVITVDAAHPGPAIAPTMFGIFFEDINFGADGGLYPELIKNRSFEFDDPLAAWKVNLPSDPVKGIGLSPGELDVRTDAPLNANNPHYLHVTALNPGYGFTNAGFRGIGVTAGAEYRFSAYVRTQGPSSLHAAILDSKGHEIGTGTLTGFDGTWKRYETVIRTSATEPKAQFSIFMDQKGSLDLDMVSLFPVDTWNHRPNGLRKDLVQLLADMHPGFIRFPGGCIVEGRRLANRYQWKKTVGDISERKTIMNRWNDEFDHRPTPDYFQSFGLGFYEYFQLAEDIGAAPLPILNCGMACQFNSSETAKLDEIHEYIQDALDLIEFANGPADSPWGKVRAQMGHSAPFHLTMIGVGNEQWGPRYLERYKLFNDALKASHPEIQLIVAAGPSPSGTQFDELWSYWRAHHADIVDEHYYMAPQWFLSNSNRYDNYDRSGPKVFAGEYAAQSAGVALPTNRNNWQTALAEAAFMTGLERNADVVRMASYAPLLAHAEAWQWTPDAIWFDNLRSFGTTDYQVQKIFATNTGTRVVPSTPRAENGLYTVASLDDRTHELILTAVNVSGDARSVQLQLIGVTPAGSARVTTLGTSDLSAENSLEHPDTVAPVVSTLEMPSATVAIPLKPNTVTVFRVPVH